MKKETDIVFIVLVYRNCLDLKEFCDSIKNNVKTKYEIVVVDAFYNTDTSQNIKRISESLNSHYISVKNGGYGYGNNRGLEYAKRMFEYKYVCICNPDTVLKSNITIEQLQGEICIAPQIIALKGKKQNPYWAFENLLSEKLIYKGYVKDKKILIYSGVLINKILRFLFALESKFKNKVYIYACHGSFFFLSAEFTQMYFPIFDEEMFLFYEEACLARILKRNGSKIRFNKDIIVNHKEDGSMNIAKLVEYPHLKRSYILYYERYRA